MRSPFKFLDSYGVQDKDVFFGREQEVSALYGLVYKTPLTLLYGLSGTGKTSIVRCGLANRFEGPDWLPFYIRREQNINESLCRVLQDALESRELTAPAALVSALFDDYLRPVYLIFDQFEELFILGSAEEQRTFAQSLQQLIDRKLPCRVILVVREEYLGQMYLLEKEIPTLFDHRLRIEPMNNRRVAEVLEKSFNKFNIRLEAPEESLRALMIEKLSVGKSGIQLPYLQVYLDMLYREDYKRDYGDRERGDELPPLLFTREEIEAFGDINNVLEKFLREQTEELQKKLEEDYSVPPQTVRRLLDAFVTEEGTKRPVRLRAAQVGPMPVAGELKPVEGLSEAALSRCLTALEDSRLLRIADDTAELAHDSLAQLIDRQRTDEERQLNEVRRRIRAAFVEKERSGVWPTERQLLSMEELLPSIELDKELNDFVKQSFQEVERKKVEEAEIQARRLAEAEEQAKQERELKLEAEHQRVRAESAKTEAENQRAEAERNERRAAKQTRLAVMVSLLALVLAGFAVWFYFMADKEKQKAVVSRKEAEANSAEAERQKQKAIVATREAENNFAAAQANLRKAEQEEKRARAALVQVEKEKEATEVQRRQAEENYRLAQVASEETKAERDRAQRALDDLAIANAAVVRLLLQNKEKDVLFLNYEQAYGNVQSAAILKAEPTAVAAAALELAFWYGETGDQARSDTMLRTAYALLNKQLDANQTLRDAIESADKKVFDGLMMRYYPLDTVRLAGGMFEMGCKPGRDDLYGCDDEEKLHNQPVRGFIVSRHETTWWQYRLFCEAQKHAYEAPDWGTQGDNPAVYVSWYDAVEYANWVSERLGLEAAYTIDKENEDTNNTSKYDKLKWIVIPQEGSKGYRLLTEAEWEYAARGGQEEAFAGCNDVSVLGGYTWYDNNSGGRTQAVKGKKPNAHGLYDMSGNVWEWCWDWYGKYPERTQIDYTGPITGARRVYRGGSWISDPQDCRVASRSDVGPGFRYDVLGFRLARTP